MLLCYNGMVVLPKVQRSGRTPSLGLGEGSGNQTECSAWTIAMETDSTVALHHLTLDNQWIGKGKTWGTLPPTMENSDPGEGRAGTKTEKVLQAMRKAQRLHTI
jgi:hypothetical protein